MRVNDAMVCGSFREACVARGLADYDPAHHLALGGRDLPAPRDIVTRLHTGAPSERKKFFLYLLLLEAAGETSFDDLRTVATMVCGSFREACVARGLADNDR
jgi:hypothetical protein